MTLKQIAAGVVTAALLAGIPNIALGQAVDGYASVMVDLFPDVQFDLDESGAVTELRARLLLERRFVIDDQFKLTAAGFVEGLLGHRRGGTESDAILRPRELHLEAAWEKADLRVGLSRVVWGRLDEFLPTDVVNPLDLARFFLEGRSEGRIPVAMVRARALPSDRLSIEGIYVPVLHSWSIRRPRRRHIAFQRCTAVDVRTRRESALSRSQRSVARTADRQCAGRSARQRHDWQGRLVALRISRVRNSSRIRSRGASVASVLADGARAFSPVHDGRRRLRDRAGRVGASR